MRTLRPFRLPVIQVAAVALVAACGGGGGGSPPSPPVGNPPVVNQSVGGIWQAQVKLTSGETVAGLGLVTENGEFYFENRNQNNGCAELSYGKLTVSGTSVTGTANVATVRWAAVPGVTIDCVYSDGTNYGTATLSGTVSQRSSLTLTSTFKTAKNTALPSIGPFTLSFNSLYNKLSSPEKTAGRWITSLGQVVDITITGALSFHDPLTGCSGTGQLSIVDANYNAYSGAFTYANCAGPAAGLNGVTATGLLTLDDGVTPKRMYAGYSFTVPSGATYIITGSGTQPDVVYGLTDLGTLGGHEVRGESVNETGQITGYSNITGDSQFRAYLYSNGSITDLGTLGGSRSAGYGINKAGQIAGWASTAGDVSEHAFLYTNGGMQDLGTLGGTFSHAHDINDSGMITGWSRTTGNVTERAFLYSNGVMTNIGTLGGPSSWGAAINNGGQVTGYSDIANSVDRHAFLYNNGVMTDLGTLGGTFSAGYAISQAGNVAGYSMVNGDVTRHAFLYSNGIMTDLGIMGGEESVAHAVNDAGQVLGRVSSIDGSYSRAFIYSDGIMFDLNTLVDPGDGLASHVTLTEGRAFNDQGWIVATGVDSRISGVRAYLLTPLH